jgi:hypothetical protein
MAEAGSLAKLSSMKVAKDTTKATAKAKAPRWRMNLNMAVIRFSTGAVKLAPVPGAWAGYFQLA